MLNSSKSYTGKRQYLSIFSFVLRTEKILGLIVLMVMVHSCKTRRLSHEETAKSEGMTVKEEVLITPPAKVIPPVRPDTVRYNYLVSFFSPGDGIDFNTAQEFEHFLEAQTGNDAGRMSYQRVLWGREGERDYCIQLKSMNQEEKARFLEAMKEIISSSKKVNVYENRPCRYLKN